jgi:hypothetical protein
VIILYSNRTGRLPPIPTVGSQQQQPPPPLGGSRQPTFQLPATDIHSSSTPPLFLFQAQLGAFDTGAEDQLAWDEIRVDDILATVEGAPQQADELAASQMTQPPPALTQPSQLATGGATTGGGATPAGGGATPAGRATLNAAGSSQAAMATPSPDQLAPRVIRALDPWTYDQDHTWAGARAVRGKRGRRI